MSEKRKFVHSIIARSLPSVDKISAAIDYAERLWDILTDRGYGSPKSDEPQARDRVDWYAKLDPEQREAFDRFWVVYDLKKGKNEAAGVWLKLWKSTYITARGPALDWILASARKEAELWRHNPPQGQTRIYAQGWLSALRWRDHPKPSREGEKTGADEPAQAVKISRLIGELNALQALYRTLPNESIKRQIDQVNEQLEIIRGRP